MFKLMYEINHILVKVVRSYTGLAGYTNSILTNNNYNTYYFAIRDRWRNLYNH